MGHNGRYAPIFRGRMKKSGALNQLGEGLVLSGSEQVVDTAVENISIFHRIVFYASVFFLVS